MKKTKFVLNSVILGLFLIMMLNQGYIGRSNVTAITQDPETPPIDPWTRVDNGTRVNITAGARTQLRTQSGTHIQLRVNESAQLRLNESDCNEAGPLLNQTRAVNRFLHIELNGTMNMTATMFKNYTNHELNGLGNVSTFRWAFFDESSFRWQYAHQNWVELTDSGATVFCETDHFSYWTILAPSFLVNPTPSTPFNPTNGSGFMVQEHEQYQIQTQSGFQIQMQVNKSVEVTIEEFEHSPKAMNQARHRIRTQTMQIELNASCGLNATFSYQFTNQENNMNKLKFMFFNESTQEWEAPQNQWIEGDMLYCNTTHFSLWTIAEDESGDGSIPGFTLIPLLAALSVLILLKRRR